MYLYTADAVSALLTVMLKGEPGCAYNAANPSTYCSVREMAEMVATLVPDGNVQLRCEIDPDAPYPPSIICLWTYRALRPSVGHRRRICPACTATSWPIWRISHGESGEGLGGRSCL